MDDEIIQNLARYQNDPLGFVRWAFPWGEPGPLENEDVEPWQEDVLGHVGEELRSGTEVIRVSRASGHGTGKSALGCMLDFWAFSTMVDTKGVVTANTETQLRTKTWAELHLWHRLFIARDMLKVTATAILSADPAHEKTWRIDQVPWSLNNTEAFAGLHNYGRRIYLKFDEASAIPDQIHEVAEGALTDKETQIIWIQFGNPTKNTGRFRETAPDGRFGARWNFKSIDSRSVSRTNKEQIKQWEEDYGEDSDFFRVRVAGIFPKTDVDSFISFDDVKTAINREVPEENSRETIMGVDVARFGDNKSVIYTRQGLDARTITPKVFSGLSTTQLAIEVRNEALRQRPSVICIDTGGVGAGVFDQLIDMNLDQLIIPVDFGGRPTGDIEEQYFNRRAEIWGKMRQWLKRGCIPEEIPKLGDVTLLQELTAPTYTFDAKDKIVLESKKEMKRRGVPSPDAADALALTFAVDLTPDYGPRDRLSSEPHVMEDDYNPLEVEDVLY